MCDDGRLPADRLGRFGEALTPRTGWNVGRPPITHTTDDVRRYASHMELAGADFYRDEDRLEVAAESLVAVCLEFVDGVRMTVTMDDFNRLGDFTFKLRPRVNDS